MTAAPAPILRRGAATAAAVPRWAVASVLAHAAIVVAMVPWQRAPLPEPAERGIALVWAGTVADGAEPAAAEPPPPGAPPSVAGPILAAMPDLPAPPASVPSPMAPLGAPSIALPPPVVASAAPPVAEPPPPAPPLAIADLPPPPVAAAAPPLAEPPPPRPSDMARAERPPPPVARAAASPATPTPPARPRQVAAARPASPAPPSQSLGAGTTGSDSLPVSMPTPGPAAVAPARPLGGSATPPPDYPPASRRRGEQGRVTLRIEVDAEGRVVDVAVQRSAGFVDLDQAAIRAVRRWRFTPATREGEPVFSTTAVDISFRLEGERRW